MLNIEQSQMLERVFALARERIHLLSLGNTEGLPDLKAMHELKERILHMEHMKHPPRRCRLRSPTSTLPAGTLLTWEGQINRRTNPDKDDVWVLHTDDGTAVWLDTSDFEII